MKRLLLLLLSVVCLYACMFGCEEDNASDLKDNKQVNNQQLVYQKAQPVPFLDYSLERDAVVQLYQARNTTVATHTVWRGDTSVVEFDCPSIGYPIPYDTSLTNPLKPTHPDWHGSAVVEQAEPNGLYPSKNSIATWVRCVFEEGVAPIPVEGKVTTFPFPVKVDYNTNRVFKAGKATLLIKQKKVTKPVPKAEKAPGGAK